MSLSAGARLGQYDIVALVGVGGMGEVYRAWDGRLDRSVAIKVLPAEVTADRRARFEREARAIASLNHPRICTLHDVGEQDGMAYLVMEYLEGQTLAQRLGWGALPLADSLEIGAQIADALDAAHVRGVAHRDLKPANVMLTRTGAVLLDFGLAKLHTRRSSPVADPSAVTSPASLTEAGAVLGTHPYMAPEQVEGRATDARTDLWALGCVLYEMVAGRRAFTGDSIAGITAAILTQEPEPLRIIRPSTPSALERIVRKCLARPQDARWQSAADVADELRWVASGSGATAAAVSPDRRSRRPWAVAVALIVVGTVAGAWWAWSQRTMTEPPPATYRQITFSGDVFEASLSHDGRTVAYAEGTPQRDVRVLVRDLAGGPVLEIWRGFDVSALQWTADQSQVLIAGAVAIPERDNGAWLAPRFGGAAQRISALSAPYVALSSDGVWLAGASQAERGFRVVPLAGGASRRVDLSGVRFIVDLRWSPHAHRLAIQTQDEDGMLALWTTTPDGRTARRVHAEPHPFSFCWSAVEDELYVHRERNGAYELLRIADTSRRTASLEVLAGGMPEVSSCHASANGERLLQVRQMGRSNLWKLDLREPAVGFEPITEGTSVFSTSQVAPDGQHVVATRVVGSARELVSIPIEGGAPRLLADGGASGAVSPDGRRLAYVSNRSDIQVSNVDGQLPVQVDNAGSENSLLTWFPDGRLAWQTPDARDYRIRDLDTDEEESLVRDPSVGWVFDPRPSPQGDRIAVWWNRAPSAGLWMLTWPERAERLVARGLYRPLGWSADGRWIYALDRTDNQIVRIEATTGSVDAIVSFAEGTPAECALSTGTLTIVCAVDQSSTDVWLVESFDPRVPRPGL